MACSKGNHIIGVWDGRADSVILIEEHERARLEEFHLEEHRRWAKNPNAWPEIVERKAKWTGAMHMQANCEMFNHCPRCGERLKSIANGM
jgi:hypothetical protein